MYTCIHIHIHVCIHIRIYIHLECVAVRTQTATHYSSFKLQPQYVAVSCSAVQSLGC